MCARLRQTQNVFLGLPVFPELEQTENDMQLVGEFVRIRPQRLYDMLYAGQILRQPCDLGAVAEK